MRMTRLMKTLMLGTAFVTTGLITTACSQAEKAAEKTIDKAADTMKETTQKMAHKVINYDTPGQTNDDHLYLEEVLGEQALSEVNGWNERTLARLTADPRFETMQADALEILNSKDNSPKTIY